MPEAVRLHLVVAHLDDELGPQRRLLELAAAPAVRLGEAALGRVLEQREHALGDLVVARGRDGRRADVVDLAVVAVEAEEERRDAIGPRLPAHADDDAVGRLLGLHLHDSVPRAGEVREIAALGDHAVEADRFEAVEPAERLVAIARWRGRARSAWRCARGACAASTAARARPRRPSRRGRRTR